MLPSGAYQYAVMPLYDIPMAWPAWIALALIMQVLFAEILQPGAFATCFRTLGTPVERQFDERGNDGYVLWLYRLFILGTAAYTAMTIVNGYQHYESLPSLKQYGAIAAWTLAVAIVKNWIDRYLLYGFDIEVTKNTFIRHRVMVGLVVCMALLIADILPYENDMLVWLMPIVIYGVYVLVMMIKIIGLMGLTIPHILLMVLYLIHVELLAMAGLIIGTDYLMRVLHA